MKKNMGMADRLIRTVIAAIFLLLFFYNAVPYIWGIVLVVFAGIFLVTSFIGYCPLYTLFGIRTWSKKI